MELFQREIPIFRNVFCGDIDRESEKELSLPDYCPDISRIIRMDATPYIENKTVNGDKCTVEGTYVYNMLYESDYNASLSYAAFSVPFSEKIDIKDAGIENETAVKIKVKRIGCKLINPRKLAVRTKSVLTVSVKSIKKALITDTVSLPDNVFTQKEVISWEETENGKEYQFDFNESYTLSEKQVPIDDAVMTHVSVEKPECTVNENRLVLKTKVTCKTLYCGEENREKYIMSTKTFPAEMVIDDITINENTKADAYARIEESVVGVEVDAYGENRVLELAYTIKVTLNVKERITAEYAVDAFIAGAESLPKKEKFVSLEDGEEFSRVFSVENRFPADKVRFTEILDHTTKIGDCRLKATEDGVYLNGVYVVSVLGKTESGYDSLDLTGEFSERISHENIKHDFWECDCEIFESDANLASDGSIDIRLMLHCEIETENTVALSAVTDITVNEGFQEKVGCLIFCYPAVNDSLWSIAKKYCVAPTEISENNPDSFSASGDIITKSPIRIIK